MCHINAYHDYKRIFLSGDFPAIARNTASVYDKNNNCLLLNYFNLTCMVDLTSGEITSEQFIPSATDQIIIWNYLSNANGDDPNGKWLGFIELPNAQNHQLVFKNKTSVPLSENFGTNPAAFKKAAEALGGITTKLGDIGYIFKVFPKIMVAAILYLADEEFPANANIIFDASIINQLDTPNAYTMGIEVANKLCNLWPQMIKA